MKGFFQKTGLLTFIIITAVSFATHAQRCSGIAVEGKVSVQAGVVEGAVIQMYQDGRRLDNYGIGPMERTRLNSLQS
jgi:hypothetical protein